MTLHVKMTISWDHVIDIVIKSNNFVKPFLWLKLLLQMLCPRILRHKRYLMEIVNGLLWKEFAQKALRLKMSPRTIIVSEFLFRSFILMSCKNVHLAKMCFSLFFSILSIMRWLKHHQRNSRSFTGKNKNVWNSSSTVTY